MGTLGKISAEATPKVTPEAPTETGSSSIAGINQINAMKIAKQSPHPHKKTFRKSGKTEDISRAKVGLVLTIVPQMFSSIKITPLEILIANRPKLVPYRAHVPVIPTSITRRKRATTAEFKATPKTASVK
mmetsp:Transcript_14283/g.18715  ORF Transcript_14283/g.18715 Transcript_14283/m.18715 type:complete len:130 (+) Transcript_14283:599-988(+)